MDLGTPRTRTVGPADSTRWLMGSWPGKISAITLFVENLGT